MNAKSRTCLILASLPAILACPLLHAEDPLELTPTEDKTISSTEPGQPNKVDGQRPTMRLMGGQEKHRICMFFDLKDQAAKPCSAAVLRIVTDKCWPNQKDQYIRVHRLVRPFSELFSSWTDSVEADKWINQGGDFDPMAVCARKITQKDAGEGKTIDIDVTPLVQLWQTKRFPNYGLILLLEDGSDMNIHIHSREAVGNQPKLLLYYASAPPKNADMMPMTALKPVGAMPQFKTEILTQSLNKASVGIDYKARLLAKGGIAPYAWKATGLPDGITLAEDGNLTGKPAKAGAYTLQITVSGTDKKSATGKLELVVGDSENKSGVALAGGGEKKTEAVKTTKKSGAVDDE